MPERQNQAPTKRKCRSIDTDLRFLHTRPATLVFYNPHGDKCVENKCNYFIHYLLDSTHHGHLYLDTITATLKGSQPLLGLHAHYKPIFQVIKSHSPQLIQVTVSLKQRKQPKWTKHPYLEILVHCKEQCSKIKLVMPAISCAKPPYVQWNLYWTFWVNWDIKKNKSSQDPTQDIKLSNQKCYNSQIYTFDNQITKKNVVMGVNKIWILSSFTTSFMIANYDCNENMEQ